MPLPHIFEPADCPPPPSVLPEVVDHVLELPDLAPDENDPGAVVRPFPIGDAPARPVVPRSIEEAAVRLAEADKALLSIRQARDAGLAKNHELIKKLAAAEDQIAELEYERDAALKMAQDFAGEREELRRGAMEVTGQKAALLEAELAYIAALTHAQAQVNSLAGQRAAAQQAAAQSAGEIAELRARLDQGARKSAEAEQLRRTKEKLSEAQTRVARQKKDLAAMAKLLAEAEQLRDTALAEAGEARQQLAELTAGRATVPPVSDHETPSPAAAPALAVDPGLIWPLLHECLATLRADPAQMEALDRFTTLLDGFARAAQLADRSAASDLVKAAKAVAQWLRLSPATLSAALPALEESVELLEALPAEAAPESPEAAPAAICVVGEASEGITAGFASTPFQPAFASTAEAALAHLAAERCDLLVLDMDLPGVDGFEIIRGLQSVQHHAHTPILAISTRLSVRQRLATVCKNRHAFLARPFHGSEIFLQALLLTLKTPATSR